MRWLWSLIGAVRRSWRRRRSPISPRRSRGPQRQGEGEAGALPWRAVDADVAAHGAGEAAGDVEAEAGAARLGGIDPLELVEDAILVFLGNAAALVGDDDRGEIVFLLGAHPDLAVLGRVA